MSELRRIAVVTSYDELLAALRARADELKLTRTGIDEASKTLPDGYAAKILAPVPMRTLGRLSFGPMLEALGLSVALIENPQALARLRRNVAERKRPVPSVATDEIVTIQISRKKLKRIASKGGRNRAAKMTQKQLSRSARRASRARWKAVRAARRARRRAAIAGRRTAKALSEPKIPHATGHPGISQRIGGHL